MSHRQNECLDCRTPFDEFTNMTGYMRCPNAFNSYEAMIGLMPKYESYQKMKEAMSILEEGGYDMSANYSDGQTKISSPIIPIISDLARRLMKYEEVNGARHHDSHIVCKACVERQSHCSHCGHDHRPKCRICGAELLPLE